MFEMHSPLLNQRLLNEEKTPNGIGKRYRTCLVITCIFFFVWIAFYLPIQYGLHKRPLPNYKWMLQQQDLRRYILPKNDTIILSPGKPCSPDIFLVVVVCSSIVNFDSRKAIRDTWATSSLWLPNIRVYFLLGRTYNSSLDADIVNENNIYSDIIQEDFVDVYNNLTLKSVMMLKWVNSSCSHVKYVLKTDDDMFIHIPNLLKLLHINGSKNMLTGYLIKNAPPVKDWSSKWFVPSEIYPHSKYPNYLSGTGYVISGDVISSLYATALRTNFFYLEDIFLTGICAEELGLKRINHSGFSYQKRLNNPCLFRNIITAHRMTSPELYGIWLKIHNSSIHC